MPQSAIPPGRHAPVRPEWLDKRREEILEPGLPIVDPHHHLWDREQHRYLLDELLCYRFKLFHDGGGLLELPAGR